MQNPDAYRDGFAGGWRADPSRVTYLNGGGSNRRKEQNMKRRWIPWLGGLLVAALVGTWPAVGAGAWYHKADIGLNAELHEIWVTVELPVPAQDGWPRMAQEVACYAVREWNADPRVLRAEFPMTVHLRVWRPQGGQRYTPEEFYHAEVKGCPNL